MWYKYSLEQAQDKREMLYRLSILIVELLLVCAAIFTADNLQSKFDFIPRSLIHLPDVQYSNDDFWLVLQFFIVVHLIVLGITSVICGPWRPVDSKRTVDEAFAIAVGFAISALLVFVTTTVSYDPQFVVGIVVCAEIFLLLIHIIGQLVSGNNIAALVKGFFKALFKRSFSIPGVLIFAVALSPGILAKLFVSDRDVANVITQIRIKVASNKQRDWGFANAFGSQVFAQPLLVRFAPGDPNTAYVLERTGRIVKLPWPGSTQGATDHQPEVVLDITAKVGYVEVENGALGFDFHPKFAQPDAPEYGQVFVYYTAVHDAKQVNRLSRFSLSSAAGKSATDSELTLMSWDRKDDGFHNGGSVEFGTDGFLYLAAGEMSAKDGHQSISHSLISGIMRIDVDQQGMPVSHPIGKQPIDGTTQHYFIPNDNPFVDAPNALGEYWALGLRNPFRISFDPRNDDLWVGDVGSTVWEEINLVRKGHNYEFPYREGRNNTKVPAPDTIIGEPTGPIFTYKHTAYERAAIGGIVYRGSKYPQLRGQYIFGDNYSGSIYSLPASGEPVESVKEIAQANQFAQRGLSSFAVSPDGKILITTLGKASSPSGEVLVLVRASEVDSQTSAPKSFEPETVTSSEAAKLFTTNCGRCHGATGKADGPDTKLMNVPIPDMSQPDFLQTRDANHLLRVIRDGGVAAGMSPMMPPWGQVFSDAETQALVEHVQRLSQP